MRLRFTTRELLLLVTACACAAAWRAVVVRRAQAGLLEERRAEILSSIVDCEMRQIRCQQIIKENRDGYWAGYARAQCYREIEEEKEREAELRQELSEL